MPELGARGFERVTLGSMPLARQVALFLNAEAVIGPHGAGLTHIAWCKPGTKVAEFLPIPSASRKARNASADFWFIAWQRQLDYRGHFGGPVETHWDGFCIPLISLVRALSA